MLRCSNPKCVSRTNKYKDAVLFTIKLTVCADRELAESPRFIDPKHFECVFCRSKAEENPDE